VDVDANRYERSRRVASQTAKMSHKSFLDLSFRRDPWAVRRMIQQLVSSFHFEMAIAFMILLNSVLIGLEVHTIAVDPQASSLEVYKVCGYCCTAVFLLEIILRLVSGGVAAFFCSQELWCWNLFDLCVVMSSLAEIAVSAMVDSGDSAANLSNMRILRIFNISKLFRVLRVPRLIRYIAALRKLSYSILATYALSCGR